jgi:DNA polymerase III subunit gamma/tau
VSGSEPAQLPVVAAIDSQHEQAGGGDHDVPPWEDLPPEAYAGDYAQQSADGRNIRPVADTDAGLRAEHEQSPTGSVTATPVVAAVSSVASPAPDPVQESAAAVPKAAATGDAATLLSLGDWRGLIRALELGGLVRELAQHCEWVDCSAELLSLRLSTAHRHLLDMNRNALDRLQDQLAAALGRPLKVKIDIGDIAGETPAQQDEIERRARHAEAVAALEADAMVRELIERFDATLVESSVKPL